MRQEQPLGLSRTGRGNRHLHLHGLRQGARLAGRGRKPQAGSLTLTSYEIRDDPDDLPIICATLTEAERRGQRHAAPPRHRGSDLRNAPHARRAAYQRDLTPGPRSSGGFPLSIRLTRRGGAVEPAPPRLALRYPRGSRKRGKAETAAPSHDAIGAWRQA